jgi:tetrahydromethanopterin S-methyltransferase subunit F
MSFDFSTLKWGRIIIGVIVGFVIALVVNILLQVAYGVVLGFQMRGAPPQEMIIAAVKSPLFQLLAALFVLLGGIVGGRIAARPAETNRPLAGLITGVLLAILAVIWRAFSWGAADLWMVIQAILAVVGGWLGGRLAARRTDEEYEELPHI